MGTALMVDRHPDGDDTPLRWGPNAARGGSAEDAIVIDDPATATTADANVETAAVAEVAEVAEVATKKMARQSS